MQRRTVVNDRRLLFVSDAMREGCPFASHFVDQGRRFRHENELTLLPRPNEFSSPLSPSQTNRTRSRSSGAHTRVCRRHTHTIFFLQGGSVTKVPLKVSREEEGECVSAWDQSLSFSPGIQNTNRKSAEAAIMYLWRG